MQIATDAPMACSLSADEQPGRLAWIRQLTACSLKAHRLDGTSLNLTYAGDARPDLERLVASERQCCGFLRFELRATSSGVELTIEAPVEAGADARWLFDQFLPQPQARKACGCAPGACG